MGVQTPLSGKQEDTRRRHAGYFLELAERNFSERKKGNQKAGFDLLESEHDNLRAALQWSLDNGEFALGKRIAALIWNFWWLRGHIREGVRWLETFLMEALQLAQMREDSATIAMISFRLSVILWVNGKTDEVAWLSQRMEYCDPDAGPWGLAHAFLDLGNLLYEAGLDEEAEKALIRSPDYFQLTEMTHGAIFAGSKLALLKYHHGDRQEANERMVRSLEAARQSIDLYVITYCGDNAAQLAAHQVVDQRKDLEKITRVLGAVDHWRETLHMPRAPPEK